MALPTYDAVIIDLIASDPTVRFRRSCSGIGAAPSSSCFLRWRILPRIAAMASVLNRLQKQSDGYRLLTAGVGETHVIDDRPRGRLRRALAKSGCRPGATNQRQL